MRFGLCKAGLLHGCPLQLGPMHGAGSSGRRAGSRTSSEGEAAPSGSFGVGREAPGVPDAAAYGELVRPLRWLDTPGIVSPGAAGHLSAQALNF